VSFNPGLWPRKNPQQVSQDFNARHQGAMTLPVAFDWAVWAAEGSDYLEKLDDGSGGSVSLGGPNPGLVDISHVRWATGNAITAIDLCAATIGRLFCGVSGMRDVSLRDFEPTGSSRRQTEVAARRGLVPQNAQDFLRWVNATRADQRYIDLHDARNPFTHSWLQRHLFSGAGGHADRTQFEVLSTSHRMNARDMVVTSAALALDRVREFVDVIDRH
jgi:hypothetical protein